MWRNPGDKGTRSIDMSGIAKDPNSSGVQRELPAGVVCETTIYRPAKGGLTPSDSWRIVRNTHSALSLAGILSLHTGADEGYSRICQSLGRESALRANSFSIACS